MMLPLTIGYDLDTKRRFTLESDSFKTHYHFIGSTGAGKTNSLLVILQAFMSEPREKASIFVIDPLGNFSRDLLRFIASDLCPEHVRRRLVYVQPSIEDWVIPFHPFHFQSEGERYYQVARAVDILLRAFDAQDLRTQPRLAQWAYQTIYAMCERGLPLAMSEYLIHPGTNEHQALLSQLSEEVQARWLQILKTRGEPERILESTRNRFHPFYHSTVLKRMFGSTSNKFDAAQLIRDRSIVIVNLGKYGILHANDANTIGALMINEILEQASTLTLTHGRDVVEPCYVVLDEFHRFVGPDLADAIPTCRQMGVRLILAHQGFDQLKKQDVDLSQTIWQARSRLMFNSSGETANILADELTEYIHDPDDIKDIRTTRKQRVAGYRKEWLEAIGHTDSRSDAQVIQDAVGYNWQMGETLPPHMAIPTKHSGRGGNTGHTKGRTSADSHGTSRSRHETLRTEYEDFDEISKITWRQFSEHRAPISRNLRKFNPGECYGLLANNHNLFHLQFDEFPFDDQSERRLEEKVQELIQKNFEQGPFISKAEADQLWEQQRRALLQGTVILLPKSASFASQSSELKESSALTADTNPVTQQEQQISGDDSPSEPHPFRRHRPPELPDDNVSADDQSPT